MLFDRYSFQGTERFRENEEPLLSFAIRKVVQSSSLRSTDFRGRGEWHDQGELDLLAD